MNIIMLRPVKEFLDTLSPTVRADVERIIELLAQYGHHLRMPHAKPIGRGLWELRRRGKPAIRVLYGFCGGEAILVLAFQKQRSALRAADIQLGQYRLSEYCA